MVESALFGLERRGSGIIGRRIGWVHWVVWLYEGRWNMFVVHMSGLRRQHTAAASRLLIQALPLSLLLLLLLLVAHDPLFGHVDKLGWRGDPFSCSRCRKMRPPNCSLVCIWQHDFFRLIVLK